MTCPRCGGNMEGGVCNECGFPVLKILNIGNSKSSVFGNNRRRSYLYGEMSKEICSYYRCK